MKILVAILTPLSLFPFTGCDNNPSLSDQNEQYTQVGQNKVTFPGGDPYLELNLARLAGQFENLGLDGTTFLRSSYTGLDTITSDTTYLLYNYAYETIYGYSPEQDSIVYAAPIPRPKKTTNHARLLKLWNRDSILYWDEELSNFVISSATKILQTYSTAECLPKLMTVQPLRFSYYEVENYFGIHLWINYAEANINGLDGDSLMNLRNVLGFFKLSKNKIKYKEVPVKPAYTYNEQGWQIEPNVGFCYNNYSKDVVTYNSFGDSIISYNWLDGKIKKYKITNSRIEAPPLFLPAKATKMEELDILDQLNYLIHDIHWDSKENQYFRLVQSKASNCKPG